jgi:type IV secretory pathway TrbL component
MLRRYRDTGFAVLAQCLIAFVLFAVFQSFLVIVAAVLVSVPIVLQFAWSARQQGAAAATGATDAAGHGSPAKRDRYGDYGPPPPSNIW